MIVAVWIPLLLPLLAVPAARRLSGWLPPRAAAWTLAATGVLLAAAAGASLGLLAAAGLLRLPPVAALGHLSLPWLERISPAAGYVAVPAAAALAAGAARLLHAAARHRRDLRAARTAALAAAGAGDGLAVLPEERADAYALPGRPGRVVVTAGMLRALGADERAALLAHERAHLAARHHLFLAAAEYAAAVHPALRLLREPLAYHLERWADEAAAACVGSRALTARAVGRAALAAAAPARTGGPRRPGLAPAAHAGPVPRRVAALLSPGPQPAPARRRTAAALLLAACLCTAAGTVLEATHDLQETVETAQAVPAPATAPR
ncbi:M48 family metalloprotease [Streptacidiphilus sp. ASG 303]|uniref:M48 family metalloprotease n=1 Tax=Streptacidiphilus sp. ASG 303 TaxID=2896847 RepID=UPI001E4129D7|nr:M48 family metalloprotease [Streptacidiphilus sp. ASG 303]MCD0483155.1 M48 family metalloprotease [Streptacidiphilus sp. ASG 303]